MSVSKKPGVRRTTTKKPAAKVKLLSGGNPQIPKDDGDAPVQAYIAAMPGWKRAVGEQLDALVVRHVPDLQKAVKWNSPFYGVEGRGWFLSTHCFTQFVRLTWFQGRSLKPIPPGPSKDKNARYLDIREHDEIDEDQLVAWIKQASALPGWVSHAQDAATSAPNPKVEWFFAKDGKWKACFAALRELALQGGLTEELKWGHPCYTLKGKNVFLMHGFNDYCALLFHKGALLKDDHGILVQQTAHVQSARQIRFTGLKEIKDLVPVIRCYMEQAIAVEQAGGKVPLRTTAEFDMPAEFARALKQMPALKKAFNALTPGRQRGYLLFFGGAKQSATREARIAKHVDRILADKGLND
ncbi:MAG: DUF1801 domain-containing protein [Flavobacteriales bacterium]|nr:DUF1801 domain-containing protein [Flavobacteriales bacterium]